MTTTLTITDLRIGLSSEQLTAVGSEGQVMLKTVIIDEDNVITSEAVEFFDTVALAQDEKDLRTL